jgi:hypothetical protein
MAVQQLAKDQAKREKQKQKKLDDKFAKDEAQNLKDIEDTMRLMEERRERVPEERMLKDSLPPLPYSDSYKKLKKKVIPGPDGMMIEAKSGGLMKKCGIQVKGTSPLLKKRKGKK